MSVSFEAIAANLKDALSMDGAKRRTIESLNEDEFLERSRQGEEHIAELTNQSWGKLDQKDGYNCPKCRNKGEIFKVLYRSEPYRYWTTTAVPCECMEKRISYRRSRMSGIPEGYEFGNFNAVTDWQKDMRHLAEDYLNNRAWKDGSWLFIGGAIGSGKTHIVSALARELVYERDIRYMNWVRDARSLKAAVNDNVDYYAQMRRLTGADVLFIDDFYKSAYVTEADKRLAYDILNERYINNAPTLFTSEMYLDEIEQTDPAVASRIYERAKNYALSVGRDEAKNWRYRL